jgi:ABC-type uncharacterized transport system ATPase subunit
VVSFGEVVAEGSFEEVIADEKVKEAYLGKDEDSPLELHKSNAQH